MHFILQVYCKISKDKNRLQYFLITILDIVNESFIKMQYLKCFDTYKK